MFWKKKKTTKRAREQLSLSELFERYNRRLYLREEQRFEMVREARKLEQKRLKGKEYVR